MTATRMKIGCLFIAAGLLAAISLVSVRRTALRAGMAPWDEHQRMAVAFARDRAQLDRLLKERRSHVGGRERLSHGDVTPRDKDDPKNARIRGCVVRRGEPVPGAEIEVIVWPTNMKFTTDSAVAGADGCYEVVITAKHLRRKRPALIIAGPLYGSLLVPIEPGRTTPHADIEVGPGFVIRGVVRDSKGAPVPHALVTDGHHHNEIRSEAQADAAGRFAIEISTLGRVQLHVHEYESTTPAVYDVERLEGELAGVVLTVGNALPRLPTSWARPTPGAAALVKLVSVRSGVDLPPGGRCTAWAPGKRGEVEPALTSFGFQIDLPPATVRLTCDDMQGFVGNGRNIELPLRSPLIEMPIVPVILNGVELGVELRAHPNGARVVGVAAEAQAAGLRADDIVVAVDDVPVAGFDHRSVYELGFKVAPGHRVAWTIERGGARIELHAKAPGPLRAPLYIEFADASRGRRAGHCRVEGRSR